MLKEILGEDVKETAEELKEWLSALSKEQLIAEMLRKKDAGNWDSDDSDGRKQKASGKANGSKADSNSGGWDSGVGRGQNNSANDWNAEGDQNATGGDTWNGGGGGGGSGSGEVAAPEGGW